MSKFQFTVTVTVNDSIVLNPGHLLGGINDEIAAWSTPASQYEVSEVIRLDDEQRTLLRVAAYTVVAKSLNMAAINPNHPDLDATMDEVACAVSDYAEVSAQTDLQAFLELQREALANGAGQR